MHSTYNYKTSSDKTTEFQVYLKNKNLRKMIKKCSQKKNNNKKKPKNNNPSKPQMKQKWLARTSAGYEAI